jgi:hypothetical protein
VAVLTRLLTASATSTVDGPAGMLTTLLAWSGVYGDTRAAPRAGLPTTPSLRWYSRDADTHERRPCAASACSRSRLSAWGPDSGVWNLLNAGPDNPERDTLHPLGPGAVDSVPGRSRGRRGPYRDGTGVRWRLQRAGPGRAGIACTYVPISVGSMGLTCSGCFTMEMGQDQIGQSAGSGDV